MQLLPASDSSVLAVLGDTISEPVNAAVIRLFRALDAASPAWLENLHPAYTTLLIDFDPGRATHGEVMDFARWLPLSERADAAGKTVQLMVEYRGEDIEEVARIHGLTVENIKQLHSSAAYRVAFLGFAPGFAYLMGLPEALATPRLATPRLRVPAGSVAIGGSQTGVYPADSPGGWRIIGRLAGERQTLPPDWVTPGDQVRFVAV